MSSSSCVMPQGGLQQLPELAAELVRLKVDVFQASGDLAPRVSPAGDGDHPYRRIQR